MKSKPNVTIVKLRNENNELVLCYIKTKKQPGKRAGENQEKL
jgi:hypothetical protein